MNSPDPARSRAAILAGTLILLLMLLCCGITLLGWGRGALDALSLLQVPG